MSDPRDKDKVPTSSKVELALAMHNFHALLKAHQLTVDQIKEANRGKENVKERLICAGDYSSLDIIHHKRFGYMLLRLSLAAGILPHRRRRP